MLSGLKGPRSEGAVDYETRRDTSSEKNGQDSGRVRDTQAGTDLRALGECEQLGKRVGWGREHSGVWNRLYQGDNYKGAPHMRIIRPQVCMFISRAFLLSLPLCRK